MALCPYLVVAHLALDALWLLVKADDLLQLQRLGSLLFFVVLLHGVLVARIATFSLGSSGGSRSARSEIDQPHQLSLWKREPMRRRECG